MDAPAERPHFTILGFPVRVSPMFPIMMVVLGSFGRDEWTGQVLAEIAIIASVVFVSILCHELGHALVMRVYGYSPSIALHGMGGHAAWGPGPMPTPVQRILVSLAGPFAGFLLGGVVIVIGLVSAAAGFSMFDHWATSTTFGALLYVNLGWGLVNLIPMLPWDGGHVLAGALDLVTKGKGRKPASLVTIVLSITIAGALLLSGGQQWWAIFLCAVSLANGVRVFRAKEPEPLDPATALKSAGVALRSVGSPETLIATTFQGTSRSEWVHLASQIESLVIPVLEAPAEKAEGRELAAWAWLLAGDPKRATKMVDDMRQSHEPSPLLAGVIALRNDRFEQALDAIGPLGDDEDPEAAGLIAAYAEAALLRPDVAIDVLSGENTRSRGALVDASMFRDGHYEGAAALGESLFERFGQAEDAYNAACSHARAGRPEAGLRWIENAVEAGYDDLVHLERDDDLKTVRALAGYASLRDRLTA